MLSLARKLILRASRREICDAERLCTDGSRINSSCVPTALSPLLAVRAQDGDGLDHAMHVARAHRGRRFVRLRAVSLPHVPRCV